MKKLYPQNFTLQFHRRQDRIEVYIPELDITAETVQGDLNHDHAIDAAHRAISLHLMKQYEEEAAAQAS